MSRNQMLTQGAHEGFPEIHANEARGNSRAVSPQQFQGIAGAGARQLGRMQKRATGTGGLDRNWERVKDNAFSEVQKPWGGATVNARSGRTLRQGSNRYAVTVKPPGTNTVSVPENVSREQFHTAMDSARQSFHPTLNMRGGHLGVFRDNDEGRIDIDPAVVVRRTKSVEQIGAATRNIGGAYHFKSGNGYFPPHVKG